MQIAEKDMHYLYKKDATKLDKLITYIVGTKNVPTILYIEESSRWELPIYIK